MNEETRVQIDQPIPPFQAQATGGRTVTEKDLQGHWTVLYFYPRDNTPGCTNEAKDFRDLYPEFQALGAEILGVSRDSLASHEKFKAKLELPFDLISDPDETLCRLFDVIKEKNMYGKKVMGIERSTFLIDPEGVLRREWRKVKVAGHAQEVLETLRQLAQA